MITSREFPTKLIPKGFSCMKKYRHLFFDLDGTLWDFNSNAEAAQRDMYNYFHLNEYCENFELFFNIFKQNNDKLWADYQRGSIKKEKLKWWRFYLTLEELGKTDEELAKKLDIFYLSLAPTKTKLIEGAMEVLDYLKKDYHLHIVTNGFNEVQYLKLKNSQLDSFFEEVITSEDAGGLKPDLSIFEYALKKSNALRTECLMIGDVIEVDILGAKNAGIDQVFLNQNKIFTNLRPTFEIERLIELVDIL